MRRSWSRGSAVQTLSQTSPLPTPERDPYFSRATGADQVATLPPRTPSISLQEEPEIVRDYRFRRDMRTIERGFGIAGAVGRVVAFIAFLAFLYSGMFFLREAGSSAPFARWQDSDRIVRMVGGVGLSLGAFLLCDGLRRGKRWSQILLTVFSLSAILESASLAPFQEYSAVVTPCALLLIFMLWRPRGRVYFAATYRDLILRTPAQVTTRETGRATATLLLTSILVVVLTNFLLLHYVVAGF